MENKEMMENITKQIDERMKRIESINIELKASCNIEIQKIQQRDLLNTEESKLVDMICINNIALEYLCKDKFNKCESKCNKAKENIFSCEYCRD